MHVNLLPSTFVWRRLMRNRIRQWGCAFGLLGVFVLVWNVQLIGKWYNGVHELQLIHAGAEPIRQLQSDRIQLATKSLAIKQKINQLQADISLDRTTSILGIIASGVGSTGESVQIQELQVSVSAKLNDSTGLVRETQRGSGPKPNANPENIFLGNQYQLTLRGVAIESESISAFMDSLQEWSVFPKIELRSTKERLVSERSVQEFQLECVSYD